MTYVQGSAASHIIYAWRGLFTTFRTPRLNSCILFLIRHDHGKKVSMEFKGVCTKILGMIAMMSGRDFMEILPSPAYNL